jgi:hypothetical protein
MEELPMEVGLEHKVGRKIRNGTLIKGSCKL